MKLIVQVPCYNEEQTLPLVINSIPKRINGVDIVETLIVDDGSRDKTVEIAEKLGVNHIVRHTRNKGLAAAFTSGINEALRLGADIIVNTDADNQYPQQDIAKLVQPIIKNKADIVIADRQTDKIAHFSRHKKFLQKLGSAMVRKLSNTSVPDAVSGFRAYSREAAIHMNIVTDFSYCIESIMQAQHKRLAISSIKVKTNPPTRKSRLFKNMLQHITLSTSTLIRVYAMYKPFKVFSSIGIILVLIGAIPAFRFAYFMLQGQGEGHIQSLIFGVIFLGIGFQTIMTGLVADLIATNRRLLENSITRVKNLELVQSTKRRTEIKRLYLNSLKHNKVSVKQIRTPQVI